MLKGFVLIRRVKAVLVVVSAEPDARIVMGMVFEHVPGMWIATVVTEPVIPLEQAVVSHNPVVLLVHVRPEQRRCDFRMIGRPNNVAQVMKECAGDVLGALPGALGPRGRLEAVIEPRDPVRRRRVHLTQPVKDPIRLGVDLFLFVGENQFVVVEGRFGHRRERNDLTAGKSAVHIYTVAFVISR